MALTPVILDSVVAKPATLGDATQSAEAVSQRAAAFNDALQRHAAAGPVEPNAPAAPVQGPATADAADARDRARRALDLDAGKGSTSPAGGDLILDGLQKLRGAFDARQGKVAKLADGAPIDTNTLLAMQVEVVNYTLLVDVTSKLTGKSTQAFDTLMKGQ